MNIIENSCLLVGRLLMGLYFIIPAISKINKFEGTSVYMEQHNVPMVPVLLVVTIIIQLVGGAGIIVGFKSKESAFILAGLTLVISLFMHNFWGMAEGLARSHELQNFFKNMGIMAGLLMITGLGTGKFSLEGCEVTHAKIS
ncbi:DoxX family protein [Colwellia hornerae]|uniref:DoxX family protein n=1 Tax=Colwellia hornerae TaxID=89402 RepID=A0A5C6Q7S5_9GAMM|nr:DoxX family protein [Colwellia hornerae]TWX52218.1 DoxX family protein [Colwellia hornerae]TWX57567.1 DoxX family protein [Colwellia hornerae]TWX64919.1 DoxX family protein [Colwellia hornerae]